MPILHPISRRGFLAGAASAAVVAACSSSSKKSSSGGAAASLPDPASAPFDTIVVLTMENRSYDHLLGWLPGTNGKQAGLSYPGLDGNAVSTYDLATNV